MFDLGFNPRGFFNSLTEKFNGAESLKNKLAAPTPMAGMTPEQIQQNALQRQDMARQLEPLRTETGGPGLLDQIGNAMQGANFANAAKAGAEMAKIDAKPLGLLQKGAAPGAAQAPQANFAAPMAAMMRPTQNNSLAMIQERLNKMIGGYYG